MPPDEHDPDETTVIEAIRPPLNRRVILAGRAAAAILAVLTLVLTGGAWQWQSSKNNSLNKVAALDLNSRDIVDPNAQFGDENFLIVGTDSRLADRTWLPMRNPSWTVPGGIDQASMELFVNGVTVDDGTAFWDDAKVLPA